MKNSYIIISPVRNEEKWIEKTLKSVINQSVLPVEWILVNDGSKDRTAEIIESYQGKHPWIKLINLPDRGYYLPGAGVVNAFYKGFNNISFNEWDYIVKLDCDLEFEADYFERLLLKFFEDSKLGIASGCTYLPKKNKLIREPSQKDHPVGPSKVYRRKCWEDIQGLRPIPGWDLADLLTAQLKDWKTACYFELKIIHYRLTGSRRKGLWGPKHLQGRFEFRHGYSFGYTLLKAFRHLFSRPIIIGSMAKLSGYIYSAIKKEPYLFDLEVRKFLRKKHNNSLLGMLKLKK